MQDIYFQVTDQFLLTMKEAFYGITLVPKKYHLYMFLKTKDAIGESLLQQSHVDQKIATM